MKQDEIKITQLPHSKESEMMVLGSMLCNMDSVNLVCETLEFCDFYFLPHQIIFDSIKKLYLKDSPVDVHLLCELLKVENNLEKAGGISYIISLAQYVGVSVHVEAYCEIVQQKSLLRKLVHTCDRLKSKSLEACDNPVNLIECFQKNLYDLAKDGREGDPVHIKEIISGECSEEKIDFTAKITKLKEKAERGESVMAGISSGIHTLDEMINGLVPGHLIIVGARPSVGKTTFGLNILMNIAIDQKRPVALFSLEMTKEEITDKMICMLAGIGHERMRKGQINDLELEQLSQASEQLSKCNILIDDQAPLRMTQIRNRARRLKELYEVEFIMIDYLGLIQGTGRYENKTNEVSMISNLLKGLAKELKIPVLCLSQLSRKNEDGKREPVISDLRDSGQIEADADEILLLHRPDLQDESKVPGVLKVIVGKNRYGKVGKLDMDFNLETGKIKPAPKIQDMIQQFNVGSYNHFDKEY